MTSHARVRQVRTAMNAAWKAGVWAWVTVTPVGMFCVADTPVPVTVVTALATEMPGYEAAKEAVTVAPLADSALDTVAVVAVAEPVGAAVGMALGAAGPTVGDSVGAMPVLQPLTNVDTQLLVSIWTGAAAVSGDTTPVVVLVVVAPWVQAVNCWHVA